MVTAEAHLLWPSKPAISSLSVVSVAPVPIPTWYFVVTVVRQDERFLMIHERKHGQRWYFPAGRVESAESLVDAALREVREEAGIAAQLTGVYRVEHMPGPDGARVRVIFGAVPVDGRPPKLHPDDESLKAGWFTLAEVAALPLRGAEVLRLLCDITSGAPLFPLSVLGSEGEPLALPDVPRARRS